MTEHDEKKPVEPEKSAPRPEARPAYEAPTLVELGTLRNLTATGSHVVPTVPEGV